MLGATTVDKLPDVVSLTSEFFSRTLMNAESSGDESKCL